MGYYEFEPGEKNGMEYHCRRTKIGRNWYKYPIENNTCGKPISRKNKPPDRYPLKCHKFGSKSQFANTFPKEKIINETEIERSEDTKETIDVSLHASDSGPSDKEELPDQLSIETINVSFEVAEAIRCVYEIVDNITINQQYYDCSYEI
ncbi:hypothetical protein O181_079476 [Austropuccinia psidii MF-1]|uniref:Uncharacterized protein n=1 Tax=Austropuccinia psidii MF-1 TaxID=1389203 RepID=A0A9Q3FGC0_9BASI|nr:hypothetical protein [Austropuccinia psidii MF-1]